MRFILYFLALLSCLPSRAQTNKAKQGGTLSLGMRSTVSAFSDGARSNPGYGAGGHFRLQLANRINTQWFLDVLSTNIENQAHRMDYHIGWSVMYYILDPRAFERKVTPYVVAGHCFDYSRISVNGTGEAQSRGSTAVQAGAGFHYNITPRFDISPEVQYMMHLGKDLHAHVSDEGVQIEQHSGAAWEGHLLLNISVNYKFAKLWNRGKKS